MRNRVKMELQERIESIERRIVEACERSGRERSEITIVAVSKKKSQEIIQEAFNLGLRHFGENYVQEFVIKAPLLSEEITWHFIGHLQRNKVKFLIPHIGMIHSIENERLGNEIQKQGKELGRIIPILLQINVSGEESKEGCTPSEALGLIEALSKHDHIAIEGLMTIPPFSDNPEDSRVHFGALRRLRDQLSIESGLHLPHLSMGMTNDFEVAIEEGATIVRIGTALFGER